VAKAAGASGARYALWIGAAAALALVAVFVLHRARSSSSSSANDNSGRPGPDLSGSSAAQEPGGGASSIPGKLPDALLVASDPLGQQVQTTDTSSPQSPQMLQSVPPGWTTTTAPGGQTYTTDVGGSPSNPPTYNPGTGSWFEGALPAPVSTPKAPAPTPVAQNNPNGDPTHPVYR
jgi:hypothetical protein